MPRTHYVKLTRKNLEAALHQLADECNATAASHEKEHPIWAENNTRTARAAADLAEGTIFLERLITLLDPPADVSDAACRRVEANFGA